MAAWPPARILLSIHFEIKAWRGGVQTPRASPRPRFLRKMGVLGDRLRSESVGLESKRRSGQELGGNSEAVLRHLIIDLVVRPHRIDESGVLTSPDQGDVCQKENSYFCPRKRKTIIVRARKLAYASGSVRANFSQTSGVLEGA
jgi:hypothetical protein